jgi:hypothetical protein
LGQLLDVDRAGLPLFGLAHLVDFKELLIDGFVPEALHLDCVSVLGTLDVLIVVLVGGAADPAVLMVRYGHLNVADMGHVAVVCPAKLIILPLHSVASLLYMFLIFLAVGHLSISREKIKVLIYPVVNFIVLVL